MDCKDWDAWRDRMSGGDPSKVHVTGTCTVPSSHTELKLDLGNEDPGDDPELLALQLTSTRPDFDDTMVVDKDVTWVGDAEATVVRVRIQGEADAAMTVRDVS